VVAAAAVAGAVVVAGEGDKIFDFYQGDCE